MGKLFALIGLTGGLSLVWIGSSGAASPPPVTLSGTTNAHGQGDVSGSSRAKLTLEQDDSYFSPTFIKVKPGEKLTVTIKNEGATAHTFTSPALKINKTIQPDKTTKVKVTIPAAGGTVEFHCDFHQSMGMQGAFYTGTGSGQATLGTTASTGVATPAPATGVPLAPPLSPAQASPPQAAPSDAPPPVPTQTPPPQTSPPQTTPPPPSPSAPQPTNPPETQPPPATSPGNGGIAF